MMTLVYFYTAHSGCDWIQREATVFFLTKSCHSPMRFVFCYQGSWFIQEHFVGKDIGCGMGYEKTFFFLIKCSQVPQHNFMKLFFWQYGPWSRPIFKTQTSKKINTLWSSSFSSFKNIHSLKVLGISCCTILTEEYSYCIWSSEV